MSVTASAPSAAAVAVARNMIYEALGDTAAKIESYSISLGEAAWRADAVTIEVHLRQLRACLIEAIGVHKMLSGVEQQGARL